MATETMQMYGIENSSKTENSWQNLQNQLQAFKMQRNIIGNLFCYNFRIKFSRQLPLLTLQSKNRRGHRLYNCLSSPVENHLIRRSSHIGASPSYSECEEVCLAEVWLFICLFLKKKKQQKNWNYFCVCANPLTMTSQLRNHRWLETHFKFSCK